MICPKCGRENSPDANECIQCGARLSDVAQGPEDMRFPESGSPAEPVVMWWQSLPFAITLAVVGMLCCCCPIVYALAAGLFSTNPIATRRDKNLFMVLMGLLFLLGIAFDWSLYILLSKTMGQMQKEIPPSLLAQ